MRVLCVAEVYAWPSNDGYRLRLANMIQALAAIGEVDMLCIADELPTDAPPPDGVRILRCPEEFVTKRDAWIRWFRSGLPRQLLDRRHTAARAAARDWLAVDYDLVLYSHVDSWLQFEGLVDAPSIVDFDNLEDLSLRASLRAVPVRWPDRLTWAARWPLTWIDAGRWHRLQQRCAAAVDRVLVCSRLDVERSQCANATVIHNGAEGPTAPRDHAPVPVGDPILLFVGLLGYAPNADAVRWFSNEVLPRVRRQLPGARFRIVGRGADAVDDVGGPGVELVGEIDDVGSELAAADVAVVPIRMGAGTRLKVVEALAHGLPAVSTTLGAEGIDVEHERHLLIADDASGFADACVRLVNEEELRGRLAAGGAELWERSYQWAAIHHDLQTLARSVAAGRG